MAQSTNSILKSISSVLGILASVAKNEVHLRDLIYSTGWELDELAGFNISTLSDVLAPLTDDLQTLIVYIENPPASFAEVEDAFNKAQDAFARLTALKPVLENLELDGPDKDKLLNFSKDLLNILITMYLRIKSTLAFNILHLLTLVDFDNDDLNVVARADGQIVRHACIFPKLKLGRLPDVFGNTREYFSQYYFPNGLQTDGDALRAAHKLFPRIAEILHSLKINTQLGFNKNHGVSFGDECNNLANGMLSVFFEPGDDPDIDFGLSLALSPASRDNLGLVVVPFGQVAFSKVFNDWQFDFNLSAGAEAFALGPQGAVLLAGGSSTAIELMLKVSKLAAGEGLPAFIMGGSTGTRLEIGELSFKGGVVLKDEDFDIDLLLEANKGKFVLKPGDGDGFLAKILPANGVEVDFDLGIGWSTQSGLYFKGKTALTVEYDFHLSLFGVVELQSLRLTLALAEQDLVFTTDTSLKVMLGPVTAIVRHIGVSTTISFVEEGGSAGIANTNIDFKPPTGIGLTIDAGGIKGGGILDFDPANKEYFGALELEFKDLFSLKAFGIINTSNDNFSLLIVITAEFTPVQLGFGFTLNGVGGLLGVNRTTNVEALKQGVKTNTLKSILFPENVVANINRIVSDLKQVFPPQEGHFLICPMGKIGWGTPTILTLELGILIEIPTTGFKILGVLKALLPEESNPLLKLQVNFLGIIDFENRYISFDASLYDSSILTFALSGDMSLRIGFGDKPMFLLSVGGFHPAFKEVPADLKNMRRITISLYDSENARIIIQNYFAITSNTVQFGARAELLARKGSWNIYGFIGYDVLFQFSPFKFIADFGAGVALRRNSSVIMSIHVSGQLSGPKPWDARGEASVSFFFFSVSVPFHVTWGDDNNEAGAPKEDILALLQAAINDDRNWKASIPANNKLHVSIRAIPDSVVHPFGVLGLSERLVPLEVEIKKFGNKLPKDAKKFEIKVNDVNLATREEREQFAPANFFDMKDSEKLSRPSFEMMKSGFTITGSSQLKAPAHVVKKSVDYEFAYLGKVKKDKYKYPGRFFKAATKLTGASQAVLSHQNNRVSMNAPAKVAIKEEQYVLAHVSDMRVYDNTLTAASYTEALQHYNNLIIQKPELKDKIQVLAEYELN